MLRRIATAFLALGTLGFISTPLAAQGAAHTNADQHRHGVHRQGALHGTATPHATPKRQHLMEQTGQHHRGATQHGGARHGDAQNAEVDRLNQMSLQQAQGAAPQPAPAQSAPAR